MENPWENPWKLLDVGILVHFNRPDSWCFTMTWSAFTERSPLHLLHPCIKVYRESDFPVLKAPITETTATSADSRWGWFPPSFRLRSHAHEISKWGKALLPYQKRINWCPPNRKVTKHKGQNASDPPSFWTRNRCGAHFSKAFLKATQPRWWQMHMQKNTPVTGGYIFNRENEMGQIWVIYIYNILHSM